MGKRKEELLENKDFYMKPISFLLFLEFLYEKSILRLDMYKSRRFLY
ncbi:hypothetical protein DET59_105138 [Rossellomorea aquimaris]|uniref:Uncharacterized protein n=1 Tax=Rossellomorea aquimaris TaxID=189382 RepID=A0A366ETM0_9BACI|nr:hypothetical protein DET59_105138 [Rossellomorea aquimaris]